MIHPALGEKEITSMSSGQGGPITPLSRPKQCYDAPGVPDDPPSAKPYCTDTLGYQIKDSGKRESFAGGMVRDTAAGKMRPDLIKDGPMFLRWVRLMTNGAVKYAARNWMKAAGQEEYDRFLESADRHYEIWYTWRMYGINIEDMDNPTTEPLKEDHAAAVYFNINGVEFVADKITPTPVS